MTRRLLIGLSFAVVGLILLLRNEDGPRSSIPTAEPAERNMSFEGGASNTRPPRLRPFESARTVTSSYGHPNPIIERVIVDKLDVCRGEENFVHVDASTVDNTDPDLKITLIGTGFIGSGATGRRLPFRLLSAMKPDDMPSVSISGWGGTHVEQRIPFVKVRDCDAAPALAIVPHKLADKGEDVFDLEIGAEAGNVLSNVTWDFGDGQKATSPDLHVVHSYGGHPQLTRFSEFLITVTATDQSGRRLSGSRTLELFNREYWKRRVGS
jgi:hypothetical protein